MQKVATWKLFGLFIGTILLIQIGLGLYSFCGKERSYRIKPRHFTEVEVRGQTYHTHPKASIDMKLRSNYLKRKELNDAVRPHLVARRDILAKNVSRAYNEEFADPSGEDTPLNLNCDVCALVGTVDVLLNTNHGSVIDSADCVFRLGLSPTRGMEKKVGKKTTARIVNSKTLARLLTKPEKLVSGHLSTDKWIYYDLHDAEDVPWMVHKLRDMKRKYQRMSFLRFNRKGEQSALSSLKNFGGKAGYLLIGASPSTLWYAVRVSDLAKCSKLTIYGVPDPKYCKRNINSHMKIRYWDQYSPVLCEEGKDSESLPPLNYSAQNLERLSVTDRRAVLGWSTVHNVRFFSPSWPQAVNK